MTKYTAVLSYDKGKVTIKTIARNWKQAVKQICMAENCPETAIKSLVRWHGNNEVIPIKLKWNN